MNLEEEYIEYAAQFSLAVLAISAAYLLDPQKIYSYTVLILIPVLFGYTAYISREDFKKSSFLAFIALAFAPLNIQLAVVSITIAFGNVLVSFFSRGGTFRDYYRVVSIPMIVVGLVLAGGFYYGVSAEPERGDEVRSLMASITSEKAALAIEETEIVEMQREEQTQMMEQTTRLTVVSTQGYVLNQTEEELGPQEQQVLMEAFQDAEQEIPAQLEEEAEADTETMGLSEQLETGVNNLFAGDNIAFLAPVVAVGFYGLHPVIGIFTGLSAIIFKRLDSSKN